MNPNLPTKNPKPLIGPMILGRGSGFRNVRSQSLRTRLRAMDCRRFCHRFRNGDSQRQGLLSAIKQCSKTGDLQRGKKLHKDAISAGLHTSNHIATALITMYSKFRRPAIAREIFDGMIAKDVFAWNKIIQGYADNGDGLAAMDLLARMDCEPDAFTFSAAIKACGEGNLEQQGIELHKQAVERGFDSDMFVANTLIHMYCKCGSIDRAREVFDRLRFKDAVSWNSMILGYVQAGKNSTALDLLAAMDCPATRITIVAALKAVASDAKSDDQEQQEQQWKICLERGIAIHKAARKQQFGDTIVATALVDMYSKCGSMDRARQVFDEMISKDVVAWNAIISGYAQNGDFSAAIDLFFRLKSPQKSASSSSDPSPDSFTYAAALRSCGGLASVCSSQEQKQSCLEKGIAIHKQAAYGGFESDPFVASILVDMYSKCGSMDRAKAAFDRMAPNCKNVVAWTSLILGYLENKNSALAMDSFARMNCEPDTLTFVAAIKACGSLAALQDGEQIHARICRRGLEHDRIIANTLMDFYGKCSSMNRAEELFNNRYSPCIVSWTSLMSGYSSIGDSSRVLDLAKKLRQAGIEIDGVTFTCILTACNHSGLVDEGKIYFESMSRLGIASGLEHYSCTIDMLGRANRLQEALGLVESMPFEADAVIWKSLLGACTKWNNLEVGRRAFDALVALDPSDGAAYVFMSDIYRSLNMWRDLEQIDSERKTGPA